MGSVRFSTIRIVETKLSQIKGQASKYFHVSSKDINWKWRKKLKEHSLGVSIAKILQLKPVVYLIFFPFSSGRITELGNI